MEKTAATAPAVRFNGFDGPWERHKLGDIGRTFTGLSGKTKDDFGHGEAQFITYMNVFMNSIANLEMLDKIEVDKKQNSVHYGDIFFTTSSETPDEVGMSSVWIGHKENIYLNSFCFGFRPTIKLNPYYMTYMLRSDAVRKKIILLAQGISRYNISKKEMMNIEVPIPSVEEQGRIGDYLHTVDVLITLHQRKLEQQKQLKQYFLQNMFPADGEKVPRIRFKGFTGDWEERKLGEIADVTKLAGFEFTKYVVYSDEGKFIAVRGLNVKNGQLILNDVKYIDDSNLSKLTRSKLIADDIIFTYVGTVGEVAIIREDDRFYLAPNVARIRVQSDDSPKFVSHYMRTSSFYQNVIFPLIATSSQPALSMENIRKFEICLPKENEEQDSISDYLDKMDNLIALHQRKLDQLQTMKKFMLQNMFI